MSDKEREFMEYLEQLIEADADNITECKFEHDPGYIYVRTHSNKEFTITVEDAA